jgi:hypothetical protein
LGSRARRKNNIIKGSWDLDIGSKKKV